MSVGGINEKDALSDYVVELVVVGDAIKPGEESVVPFEDAPFGVRKGEPYNAEKVDR